MKSKRKKPTIAEVCDKVIALILGGGRGSRLYPLTAERAKPAVPLGGRYRLVDIPLSNCIHSGINRIFVLTQFNSASLHRHINNTYKFDNFSGGFVEILAAEQRAESGDWFQGTADAVRKHLREIDHLQASHYLILSGDQLYRMDYRQMLETHLNQDACITVGVLPVMREAAKGFGVLKVETDGRIVEFVEKPQTEDQLDHLITPHQVFNDRGIHAEGREYLASMGVYIFKPEVLETILRTQPEWIDFGRDVIPRSLEGRKVISHLFTGFWEDIGTVRSYYETSLQMVGPNPPFRFHENSQPIYSRARYLPGSQISNARINEAVICEGCSIDDAVITRSVIGVRAIIRSKVTIDNSIVMGADYFEEDRVVKAPVPIGIGEGSRIVRAIVDKNARIGKNVVIEGGDHLPDSDGLGHAIRDGIVIVLKSAIIPDGMRIGV
ncbi:MAG: glucose-1-phosphate adenylyltransferase [Candidatus Hydrogenedentes bacterium]|nr:glucose-1-phosphate adenylyltransferase [Candidatus Hydrogenedentota bacterium]